MKNTKKTKGKLLKESAMSQRLTDELRDSALEHKRIEEAIKGSEERYRDLVENAHDVLWVFDLNLGYTYISPSVKRLRGYSVEEAMKLSIEQLLSPASYQKSMEIFERERRLVMDGHRHSPDWSITTELEMNRKDGSLVWTEVTMNPLYDEQQRIKGIMGITRDISDRKKAEEALSRSEAKYRFLTENMNDIVWTADLNLNVTYDSPAVERVLGFTVNERMTQEAHTMLTPDSFARAVETLHAELKRDHDEGVDPHRSIKLELEYYHKNGSIVWMECIMRAIRNDAGDIIGIHGVSRDITERKQAEEELKKHRDNLERLVKERTAKLVMAIEQMEKQIEERKQAVESLRVSEEIYRIHFSLSNDVMFTSDEAFRVLSVTPNVERILGYKPKELIGKTFLELEVLHPDDMGKAVDDTIHVLSGGASRRPTYRFITKDGKIKFGEVSGVPLIKKGHGITLISVARDVTERMEKEQSLLEILDRYNTHFTLTDDVMFSFDHKLRFNSISPNVEKVTGYKPEELIGKPAHKLGVFPPEYQHEAYDEAMHLLSGQTINSSIYEFITKDGKRKFGEFSSSPLKRDGRVVEIITVAREITERIKKEKSLQETEATAQALLNACTDFMVLIDITGTIIHVNKAASDNLGRSVNELLGTCFFDEMPKEVADRRKIYVEKVISSGSPVRFKDENQRKIDSQQFIPRLQRTGKGY